MLNVIKEIAKKALANTKLNMKSNLQKQEHTHVKNLKRQNDDKKILMEIKAKCGQLKRIVSGPKHIIKVSSGGSKNTQ